MTAPSAGCDADPRCRHAACFQIQMDATAQQQVGRPAVACAYHVADVIEAVRAWAREHDLVGGQLTILAIEPAAYGRQAGTVGGPKEAALREFAFTTLPLKALPSEATEPSR